VNRHKRFIVSAAVTLGLGTFVAVFSRWYLAPPTNPEFATAEEIRAAVARTQATASAENKKLADELLQKESRLANLERMDPGRRVRLAIGWLGLPSETQDSQVADLTVADLTPSTNLELVDRLSLNTALQETAMTLSGLVRAQSAIRVGKLLRADWFLLGTASTINAHQFVLARIVDARTGITRDFTAVPGDRGPLTIAAGLADFVRESRNDASTPRRRTLLAIGAFRNVSDNARLSDFGEKLRTHLLTAYQTNSGVTLLERESVDTLLREVRLDTAGLADKGGTSNAIPLLSAVWLVYGDYQSYEVNGRQVELALKVMQTIGRESNLTLVGSPDEAFYQRVKESLDTSLTNRQLWLMTPDHQNELVVQMKRGDEFSRTLRQYFLTFEMPQAWRPDINSQELEEAIRAYETVLLLDPSNRLAKLHLALCLENLQTAGPDEISEARNYLREVAEASPTDDYTVSALSALGATYRHKDDAEAAIWFRKAAAAATNDTNRAARLLTQLAVILQDSEDALQTRDRSNPTAADLAEDHFRTSIRHLDDTAKAGNWVAEEGLPETIFDNFLNSFGDARAVGLKRLNEILPDLTQKFPEIAPHLLAFAFVRQSETNNPLLAQFEASVESCSGQAAHMRLPGPYFTYVSHAAAQWCLDHRQYAVVPRLMEAKRRAISINTDASTPSITMRYPDTGVRPTMKLTDVKLPVEDSITLATAYIGMEKWKEALEVIEALPSRPLPAPGNGNAWVKGTIPGVPSDMDALCRQKLGMPVASDPRAFKLGKPVIVTECLSFTTAGEGLWLAARDKLVRLDFNLATNLAVPLSEFGANPSSVCASASHVYVATQGAGLFDYDQTTGQNRQFTAKDGLHSDHITRLLLQGETLWIGFGDDFGNGGVGRLDVPTGRFTAFTPPIASTLANDYSKWDSTNQAPRQPVSALAAKPDGDVVVASLNKGIQIYDVHDGRWQTGRICQVEDLACNSEFLAYVDRWGALNKGAGLQVETLGNQQWHGYGPEEGIPQPSITAIALNGQDAWIAGRGFIGVFDLKKETMRKFCYTQAPVAYHLEIAGGCVWVQLYGSLYRIPLSVAL